MKLSKIKKSYLIITALVIIGGGYYWYSQSKNSGSQIRYVTVAAEKGTLSVSVTGSGQAEAVNQVELKPVVAGDAIDVVNVYVKNDQEVKKGDLVALLDPENAQNAVRNAELDLESAENKYKQVKENYEDDEADKYDKKSQAITVEQKKNTLADAKKNLSDYYIRAPFDGIVTSLSVSSGDSVSRSDILASVITKNIQAKVSLNEVDAVRVKIGDMAELSFDALPDLKVSGKVIKIDTIGTLSQGVATYNAEISLDSQPELLKPGMNVSASIITDVKEGAVIVPASAVKTENNKSYVEILKNGAAERKTVEIGSSNDTQTEILNGLSAGDKVITQTINLNAAANPASTGGGLGGGGAFRALH
ncbi:MAG: efflux RND transporter periplasmic adaptor subunit [Parcubacteria group bacterium]